MGWHCWGKLAALLPLCLQQGPGAWRLLQGALLFPGPAFLPAWLLWLQHERRNVIGPLIYTVSWPFRYPLSLQK